MPGQVYLMVGTHKGGFLFVSDVNRESWQIKGPFFRGTDVHYMTLDTRQEPVLYAAVNSSWWGSDIRFSRDFGVNWTEPAEGIRFPETSGNKVARVWYIMPGNANSPGVLYAGVDPGALFRSDDAGQSWTEINALSSHESRERWSPGMGGMMVHSICTNPDDADIIHVGISAAGVFSTDDGGKSWQPPVFSVSCAAV